MITLYAHALILPMFRVMSSCIMTYIIILCHCFQFIACFFYKFCFVLLVFVDLTLLVMFLSVFKNSKTHKNWKISKKFDRLCCVYHMWVWPSTVGCQANFCGLPLKHQSLVEYAWTVNLSPGMLELMVEMHLCWLLWFEAYACKIAQMQLKWCCKIFQFV